MNREERVKAAIAGKEVDRVPVDVWMHFSDVDQDPVSLAIAQKEFNEKYDFDFIKMMPFGLYTVQDWGTQVKIYCDKFRAPIWLDSVVKDPAAYSLIEPLDANHGSWGKQLQFAQHLSRMIAPHTPFIQTIFSPLTTLRKLIGERLLTDIKEYPKEVHQALRAITETTNNFVKANMEAGVSGFFFATQVAQTDLMTDEQYAEFAQAYDLEVINSYCDKTYFNVIHIHGGGSKIRFEQIANGYPVNVINWHDRNTYPSMREARAMCDKCFLGGLLEAPHVENGVIIHESFLNKSTPEGVQQHVKELIAEAGERHLMIGPGCVVDPHAPEENIAAVRKAVER